MAVQDGHDASGWCQTFQFILSYPTQPTVSNAHATNQNMTSFLLPFSVIWYLVIILHFHYNFLAAVSQLM